MDIQMQFHNPGVTQILGLPTPIQPVVETDPDKIVHPFQRAQEYDKLNRKIEAEKIYLDLMNQDFENPILHAALGMNYASRELNGLGFLLISTALHNAAKFEEGYARLGMIIKDEAPKDFIMRTRIAELYNGLGSCFKHENRCDEARKCFMQADTIMPNSPDIQNNMGTLFINEGKPEDALVYFEKAIALSPDHGQAHWNKSLALLEMGKYKEAWPEYFYGLQIGIRQDRKYTKEVLPYWDGSKDKTIIVYGEQGLGDEILFMSMLNELISDSKKVVLECHKRLHTLFAESFPTIDIYPTREDDVLGWCLKPDGKTLRHNFDCKSAVGDIAKFYRNDITDFPGTPFIKAPQKNKDKWKAKLDEIGPKPKIGISWIGGQKRTRVEVRSMPLEQMLPIIRAANYLGFDVISLQYTPCEAEVDAFNEKYASEGLKVHHWPECVYAFEYSETAGLVSNLDLVVSVATSVIHLAGAMGVPIWVLTASRAAWREYYGGDKNPWYASMRMFRQEPDSVDWSPAIERICLSLGEKYGVQKV